LTNFIIFVTNNFISKTTFFL